MTGHGAAVVWLTGLPAAGKSTVARRVVEELRRRNIPVEQIDGDALRAVFPETGFSREERGRHVGWAGYLASRLEAHGITSVVSLVSPYRDARDAARGRCRRFIEVYVATPLAECERRDPKGHYAAARRGEIEAFTGVSDPYEAPVAPEVIVDTIHETADDAARAVLAYLDASS